MAKSTIKTPGLTTDQAKFAFDFLQDELETLLALSITLMNQLEPDDPQNHEDYEHITAWRLSQVLNDRLSSVAFTNNMRTLLLGSTDARNSSVEVSHA